MCWLFRFWWLITIFVTVGDGRVVGARRCRGEASFCKLEEWRTLEVCKCAAQTVLWRSPRYVFTVDCLNQDDKISSLNNNNIEFRTWQYHIHLKCYFFTFIMLLEPASGWKLDVISSRTSFIAWWHTCCWLHHLHQRGYLCLQRCRLCSYHALQVRYRFLTTIPTSNIQRTGELLLWHIIN